MNAERLHAMVISLNQEIAQTDVIRRMQEMVNALQSVVSQPHPSHQQQLSQSLKALYPALVDTTSDRFSPAWRQILCEIGGEDLFGASLKRNIETIIANNQMTPAVALEELQELQRRLQAFKKALDQCAAALHLFKIGYEELAPGECEIGLLIPRTAVNNQLLGFAGELRDMGFILNTFSEVATGKKDDLEIRTISSTDLLVYLQAAPQYAACLAVAVERVVALYKQLLEIKKLRQLIKQQGVPDKETTGIENHANQLMKNGIDKIAVDVVNQYHKRDDKARKNELTNAVRISLNRLANRIDKGFNIEVRAEPIEQSQEEDKPDKELHKAVTAIRDATANMQFKKVEGPPILALSEANDVPKKKE